MAADLLRRAATLMRERAQAATPGPWLGGALDGAVAVTRSTAEFGSHDGSTFAITKPGVEIWNPTEAVANAVYIAGMDPAVALAVADWLWHEAGSGRVSTRALAVARAYLGEDTP